MIFGKSNKLINNNTAAHTENPPYMENRRFQVGWSSLTLKTATWSLWAERSVGPLRRSGFRQLTHMSLKSLQGGHKQYRINSFEWLLYLNVYIDWYDWLFDENFCLTVLINSFDWQFLLTVDLFYSFDWQLWMTVLKDSFDWELWNAWILKGTRVFTYNFFNTLTCT